MPDTILMTEADQPLTTIPEDIDINIDEKHGSNESLSTPIHQKQKSLISIYDNNLQQHTTSNSRSLIGIIGRNERSEAFRKRLLLSGFSNPILCDINPTHEIDPNYIGFDYVSYETFYELSPTIILVTDNLTETFEDFFPQTKQQLVVDTREIFPKSYSTKSYVSLTSIPGSYRAFGNLSNWEIENGTQRIAVAIEQYSPLNLIKFIYDLNCFSRGIHLLDYYSYNNTQLKALHNCLFPLISTIIIFSLCFILSITEYNHQMYQSVFIYRQASSITATTSIILLTLLFLIKPVLEIIEFTYSVILKSHNFDKNVLLNLTFVQHCLQSRCYLSWYSISFAFVHILLISFSKIDFNSKLFVYGFFFGLFTLILLCILSYVYFPWISERLLWNEYHFLTSYIGPICLLIAFIHVVFHWKSNSDTSYLKSLSFCLPLIVLMLYLIIYGIIHPIVKLMQWIDNRQFQNKTTRHTLGLL